MHLALAYNAVKTQVSLAALFFLKFIDLAFSNKAEFYDITSLLSTMTTKSV